MAEMGMYDPFDELKRIEERLASIFGGQSPMGTNMNMPSMDIRQHGNDIIVTADMPGVDRNDIQINVRDDRILEISAQKKTETKAGEEKAGYLRQERKYMGYYRSITLPAPVDKSKAKASYNNGVLEITLPVMAKAEEKKGEIQVT